jgi:regulatory protein
MDQDAQALHRAKQQAYRLLAYRSQTSSELRDRLARRGYTATIIDEVLQHLASEGYLNDRKLALDWARYRLQTKPLGRRRLGWELQRRGIDREVVQEILQQVYAEFDEVTLAAQVARKRLRTTGPPNAAGERQRLTHGLMRLGFEPDTISAALVTLYPHIAAHDSVSYDEPP